MVANHANLPKQFEQLRDRSHLVASSGAGYCRGELLMTMRGWRAPAIATSGLCSAFFMAWAVVLLSSQLALAQFTDPGVMVSGQTHARPQP
jgi:hypothetical protein